MSEISLFGIIGVVMGCAVVLLRRQGAEMGRTQVKALGAKRAPKASWLAAYQSFVGGLMVAVGVVAIVIDVVR